MATGRMTEWRTFYWLGRRDRRAGLNVAATIPIKYRRAYDTGWVDGAQDIDSGGDEDVA